MTENPASAKPPDTSARRSFLAGLLAAGSAAVGALLAVPLVRFTLHPVLARTTEKSWSDVGSIGEFQSLDAPAKKLVTIEQRDGYLTCRLEGSLRPFLAAIADAAVVDLTIEPARLEDAFLEFYDQADTT